MASSKPTESTASKDTKDTGGSKVVPFEEGTTYGYIGEVHPEKNNDDYTVAGVTGGTGNVADKPSGTSVDTRAKWAPLQKP